MTSPTVIAVIPAAGKSTRMGSATSKALLSPGNRTVIERTLETVLSARYVSGAVVLAPKEELEAFQALLSGYASVHIIPGGDSRQASVRLGLEFLQANSPPDYVLVHDAARCLVSPLLVERSIKAAFEHKAVTAAVPVVDTITTVGSDGCFCGTLDREKLRAIQTPQAFLFTLLFEAHHSGMSDATDDASLVEPLHPVALVEGERMNIKVTAPEDLLVIEKLGS